MEKREKKRWRITEYNAREDRRTEPNNRAGGGKRAKMVAESRVVAENRVVVESRVVAVAEAREARMEETAEAREARVVTAAAVTKGIRQAGIRTTDRIVGACVLMTTICTESPTTV
jgi:hypothetical protein